MEEADEEIDRFLAPRLFFRIPKPARAPNAADFECGVRIIPGVYYNEPLTCRYHTLACLSHDTLEILYADKI